MEDNCLENGPCQEFELLTSLNEPFNEHFAHLTEKFTKLGYSILNFRDLYLLECTEDAQIKYEYACIRRTSFSRFQSLGSSTGSSMPDFEASLPQTIHTLQT